MKMENRRPKIALLLLSVLSIFVAVLAIYALAPVLFGYLQAYYPLPPEWDDLEVVYLSPPDEVRLDAKLDPNGFARQLNIQTVATPEEFMLHSEAEGLDVFIFEHSVLPSIDRSWAIQQYQHGTAFVGLNVTPFELGTLVMNGQFADWSKAVYAEPFISATFEKRVNIPNLTTWLFSIPHRFPGRLDILGHESAVGANAYIYTPVKDNLPSELEAVRTKFDRRNLVRP